MGDAGGPGSTRKCPGVALADLGDTEGYEKGGEEGQLYAFELSDGVYKRKKVTTQKGGGAQKLGELSDVDVSYVVPRRLHQLAFTGSRWVTFSDPVQEMGWMIDIRISSPYVATGQHHKVQKVTNSGTRLCSYVPETKNVVISEQYTLKTSNSQEGILKMVSEFSPAGIIGAGKEPTSTILLEVILGDPPNGFIEVLPSFKLKWTSAHAQKELGALIRVPERPLVRFTLKGVQHGAEHRFLDISKIHVGPVKLKRLRFTLADLTPEQRSVVLSHLNLPASGDS